MGTIAWFLAGPFVYLAGIVCVAVALSKIFSYQTMPRHIRWDLYPVPHQGPAGSKYQEVDFYKAPHYISKAHELKEMLQEMIFIKKAFINNPTVWRGSFPLHAGIYMWGVWLALLVLGAFLELAGAKIDSTGTALATVIYGATIFFGVAGLSAGLLGTLILLKLRYTDEGLRDMSTFSNYLSLYIMLLLFASGLFAWLGVDSGFSMIRSHFASMIALSPADPAHPLVVLEMFAIGIFLLYLPFSQMMHVGAKYFFYHNIMWDDEPMKPGSKMSQDIGGYLHYKVGWSAPHIKKSGSWLDQLAEEKPGGENK